MCHRNSRHTVALAVSLTCLRLVLVAPAKAEVDGNWPGFRGAHARGVAQGASLPTEWSVADTTNVLWRVPVAGLGHSSPVIWGDRIYLTTAISGKQDPELKVGLYGDIDSVKDETTHRFMVHAFDKRDGKLLWKRTAREGVPRIERHPKASHANCTVATDGKHVVAFFGSEGLFVYDVEGELLWKKDFGVLEAGYFEVPGNQWGFASSPVIHEGKVIIQVDVKENSFLAAFAADTGKELWRTARHDVPTWSTPTVHVGEIGSQVIVNGYRHMGGYDLSSGKEVWRMHGRGDIPTPTPYVVDDLIYVTQAHGGGMPVYAIKTTAVGDISLEEGETANKYVAWSAPRGGSYMPTTVVYDGLIYILRDNGILRVRDAKFGELHYEQRITGNTGFTASLVAGDGKVYLTAETGEVYVVRAGREYRLLATNEMGEVCMATPAISDGILFFRTRNHLVAVGR
ncbi:MAG: PQQ-like beta-propeller repeat protein [bacterium]|nr:PQQ-like beta-propeller repeat protein [bacterium]